MTGAEWPELETAFGRALMRAESGGNTEALEKLLYAMWQVADGAHKRALGNAWISIGIREELPESDPKGNDKRKEGGCTWGDFSAKGRMQKAAEADARMEEEKKKKEDY